MTEIRFVRSGDRDFWYSLGAHFPVGKLENKVREERGYVPSEDGCSVGPLWFHLFWDNIPFHGRGELLEGH